ncbi:MAG: hypothetical protein GX322_12115 [Firmicutes bacterium]|nr:hypothetical protein [Bacillota bacterium]
MPTHYTLRMQFGPHQDADIITDQLLKLVEEARVDEIMFFFFAEEMNDGHGTLEDVRTWIENSRPYRKALAEAGITVSLNPWHSLLHADRGRRMKSQQKWQPMVDRNGKACTAVVCPLDQDWRAYYEEVLRLYSQEGFRVIWIDDDIRYHNHEPLEWGGCFCPLHVAEFNRRMGTNATREEITANCLAPGEPHPWRDAWLDMWEETHLAMISRWREIIESGGSRLGLMSSLPEAHAAEGRRWADWWKALAGERPPIHRPHFWGYSETVSRTLPNSIALLDQNRQIQPENVESGPEIECFPYGNWNKSFRQIGAQMALAQICGSTNLNISLYDFMGNWPDDEPERARFLSRWRGALDWLADQFPMTLKSVGIGIPWSPNMGRKIHVKDHDTGWKALQCPSRGWANWLGASRQAFSMRPSPSINALAGPVVWSFSQSKLHEWLSQGVLLDGEAAAILVKRGMGHLIGFETARMIDQTEVLYSMEQISDEHFGLRQGAQMSVNAKPYTAKLFQGRLLDGARLASDLRSPTQNIVGHGLVLYQNELGGRVATVPWCANAPVEMNIHRATQLQRVIGYLGNGVSHGNVEGSAWLVPQFLKDGERWRGVIWNAGADTVARFTVNLPTGWETISSAIHVKAEGERSSALVEGNQIVLVQPMHQWEFVVIY